MPSQRPHWDLFVSHHHFEECETCNAVHVVCEHSPRESAHVHESD
jgi:hypothetical protein